MTNTHPSLYKLRKIIMMITVIHKTLIILLMCFNSSISLLYSEDEIITEMNRLSKRHSLSKSELQSKSVSQSCETHEIIRDFQLYMNSCPTNVVWNINSCRRPPVYLGRVCTDKDHKNFSRCKNHLSTRLSKSLVKTNSGNGFIYSHIYEKIGVGCIYQKK